MMQQTCKNSAEVKRSELWVAEVKVSGAVLAYVTV